MFNSVGRVFRLHRNSQWFESTNIQKKKYQLFNSIFFIKMVELVDTVDLESIL